MMMKTNFYRGTLMACLMVAISVLSGQISNAQTFCIEGSDQIAGVQDGYRYELWNQNAQGNACMTLGDGALFSGEWSDILNYLARRGLSYDQTQEHQEIGTFYATYDCDYNPSTASGNSYLSIYGWTVDPLIEYYIVEDWRNWIPSMADGVSSKGSFSVNGSTYDIYENTRTNQPSIVGTATFQQYFSIRRDTRNSGTINISDHFEQWESLGMDMGDMHEVSYVVEGYQSDGDFEFSALDVFISDDPVDDPDVDSILDTQESITPEYLSVYPNPNTGNVSIQLDESAQNASMKIYDASGKTVFFQEKIKSNLIQVSNLKSGIYLVEVSSDEVNYTTKILVN